MLTSLLALITSTTFIIWGSIFLIILMTVLLEFEKEGWVTTLLSLGLALWLWNFGGVIWGYVSTNILGTICFGLGYVIMGIVWSMLKWRTYVKDIFDKAKDIKKTFIAENGKLDKENWKGFIRILNNSSFKDSDGYGITLNDKLDFEGIAKEIAPVAYEKKQLITAWISYWPLSLTGTLLNNPFRRFFEMIYKQISGLYDKITTNYQKNAFGE